MSAAKSETDAARDALKRAAAEAAVELVQDGMVVGLGTGSTAAFAVEALARRHRQGLRFVGIPTSERTAAQAREAGIPLTSFGEHRQIDLTIDGADEVERGTLNLIKGLGGALLREKIVAAASHRLAIIVDGAKLVDRLGSQAPVPVEVVAFGLEATQAALEALGAHVQLRRTAAGEPFVTDSGNRILDCSFGPIGDPARLEERIGRVVGVVESGLFISRADPVFVADTAGVHRFDSAQAHRGTPPILVIMGVSSSGKTTIAKELAERLGWPFEEGDDLHPEANVAKMRAGEPLTDADREPWLEAVAAWIDRQRAGKQPGIITCSALKRAYRRTIIGDRPEVRLVYLRGGRDLIAERLAKRRGHFMPASLLQSQFETLEEPGPEERPLTVDIGPPVGQVVDIIIRLLGASAVPRAERS
jgi:ribose 5-phosphate isomerase A